MKMFGNKVLLKYKCGSHLFNLNNENSDVDYVIVVENFNGFACEKVEGIDYHILGIDKFREKMLFDKDTFDYLIVFNLDTYKIRENVEYLDDSFKEEFEKLINVDWEKALNPFLNSVVNYFSRYIGYENKKCMYHLYLINEFVKVYKDTGKFEYPKSEEVFNKALKFKNDSDKQKDTYTREFKRILKFLSSCIEED